MEGVGRAWEKVLEYTKSRQERVGGSLWILSSVVKLDRETAQWIATSVKCSKDWLLTGFSGDEFSRVTCHRWRVSRNAFALIKWR